MKLVASLVARNELGRYLTITVPHLLEFCDEVVVLDDASDDGTSEYLASVDERVVVHRRQREGFFKHEGRIRQQLLELTWARTPSHVLATDADELVSDGAALRGQLEHDPDVQVWRLPLEEIWHADADGLRVREDGGWRTQPRPLLWKAPPRLDGRWKILPRQLACGRIPVATRALPSVTAEVELLHFGWTDEAARAARYARYQLVDRGRFHARSHLDSIMWPDAKVTLRDRPWPAGEAFELMRVRLGCEDRVLEVVNGAGVIIGRFNERTGAAVA